MKKFTLEITLGNDEMRTKEHIVNALEDVILKLKDEYFQGNIRDINGNVVGVFVLK